MINFKILDFLMNQVQSISVLNCSSNYEYTEDLFEIFMSCHYSKSNVDLGVIMVRQTSKENFVLIDGKRRLISIMLLLKAFATYLAEISPLQPSLIKQIHSRYLKNGEDAKLNLFGFEKTVFNKILESVPFTYNEKQTEIYRVYKLFLENIRNMEAPLEIIYKLFEDMTFKIIVQKDFSARDLFYSINKSTRSLNQMMLIKSYLAEAFGDVDLIDSIYSILGYKETIFNSFMKAYLSPKFNCMITNTNLIYDYFYKYIEMVKKYQKIEDIKKSITNASKIYKKMYNAEYLDADIRNMFIKIMANEGSDTFAYLLELCEDFDKDYVSKETLLQIGKIINTYILERKNKDTLSNISFSQMAGELNTIIYQDSLNKK